MPISGEVNVIFHGVFYFRVAAGKILVLAPKVVGHGVPVAGPFQRQIPFFPASASTLSIAGVDPGKQVNPFDPDRNLFFRQPVELVTNPDVHGFIELAPPQEMVISERQLLAPLGILNAAAPAGAPVAEGQTFSSHRPCAVQILRYSAPDLQKVALSGSGVNVRANPFEIEGKAYLNLHISNDDTVDSGANHRGEGFAALMRLVKGFEAFRLGALPERFTYSLGRSSSEKGYHSDELRSALETGDAIARAIGGSRPFLPEAESGSPTQDCFSTGGP